MGAGNRADRQNDRNQGSTGCGRVLEQLEAGVSGDSRFGPRCPSRGQSAAGPFQRTQRWRVLRAAALGRPGVREPTLELSPPGSSRTPNARLVSSLRCESDCLPWVAERWRVAQLEVDHGVRGHTGEQRPGKHVHALATTACHDPRIWDPRNRPVWRLPVTRSRNSRAPGEWAKPRLPGVRARVLCRPHPKRRAPVGCGRYSSRRHGRRDERANSNEARSRTSR